MFDPPQIYKNNPPAHETSLKYIILINMQFCAILIELSWVMNHLTSLGESTPFFWGGGEGDVVDVAQSEAASATTTACFPDGEVGGVQTQLQLHEVLIF